MNGMRRMSALAVAATLVLAACSANATPSPAPTNPPAPTTAATVNCVSGSITEAGSTALQPLIQDAATAYQSACPGATITVNGGGSGTGLGQVDGGSVQIGASDVLANTKLATPDADTLVDHVVCRQGWIVVTNLDVTGITNLTTQQNIDIWTGTDTNWSQVGGPNIPIVLIFRPQSSGTRATFLRLVLGGATEATGGQTLTEDSNGAVTTAVTKTNGAVSVIGFSYYNDPANKPLLNGLQLDGVSATIANVGNGTYKLAADGNLYTKGTATGLTAAFLDFMMGPEVQGTIIPKDSYGPVSMQ
jgi:phosphate transport system substrate-binding protein